MTVISSPVSSIAGADDSTVFAFRSILDRESDDGTGLITAAQKTFQAVGGVLTTTELDPGPAYVWVGPTRYRIEVPDSDTPILLWPLIQAGLPVPPAQEASAVRNGGGIARAQRISQTAYDALETPDPETLYVVP
ncbi:phage upper tail fiber protein [Nocardia puris]|uniref:phage upper tail fiber protein n=1 Tax=Nocardia puris TaxID=208602 RepID=UPI002E24E1D6